MNNCVFVFNNYIFQGKGFSSITDVVSLFSVKLSFPCGEPWAAAEL